MNTGRKMKSVLFGVCALMASAVLAASETLNPVIPFLAITGRPTEADVAAKVEALKADGFDQFLVYARSGLQYRYMGEEWLRTVEACCREGEKRGMKVWLYDEFNWPSGTCKGRVPALDERFRYSEWAVYPKAGGGYRWEIVYAPAGWVNVCEPEAMRAFIRMTHEIYEKRLAKYFASKTIPGIFSDEPGHPTAITVGKDCARHFRRWIGMEDEYRAETGRDFRADVEAFLAGKGSSDVWAAYLRLMGRRFRTCYFDQIRAWCDKMGIFLTGHLISENWLTDSVLFNGDPLLSLKGESLPGMDEIFSIADWNKGTEWLTLATVQHAAYRVGNGGLVELYACGPNDMTPARMRQMIWLCALHGVDHYLTSMQVMDQRGLVEKHGYFSPVQNGQPWHGELRPLFADAKRAAALARRPDVVRHAAVRLPLAATAHTAFNKLEHPKLAELLRSCGGRQLSLDLIAEDEKTDLPYVFEPLVDGGFRETVTGTAFAGKGAADRAAAWLLQRTAKAVRFYEADGKVAEGLIVREWSDGTVAALDVMNRGVRKFELVRGSRRTPVELAPRGVFVSDGAYPETITVDAARQVPLALGEMPYALDRDNVFRAPFATNRIARFNVKAPVKGARLVLRTCAMSYAVTASGRPVDDTEGAPPNERVLRHVAVPYSFELDGRPIAAARPADSLPVEFRPLYAETEPMDLTPGEHALKLVTGEDDCNYFLPAAFVAGRFAVQGNALVSLPEKLTTAPVVAQGFSNYCGQVTYALDGVTRPEGATALRLDVGNVFARVRWNGADLGGRGWAPCEWKLPADAAKTGRIEVTVFTSVWNIFGERERPDAKWDTHFWNAQHDAESNPSLKAAIWIR